MRHSLIRNSLAAAGLVLTFAAAPLIAAPAQDAGAAQSSDNQTVPDKVADSWITTKVKSEFATTKDVHATEISVETTDGVVALSGTVSSAAEKVKAEELARNIKGVKRVDASGLNVNPMQH